MVHLRVRRWLLLTEALLPCALTLVLAMALSCGRSSRSQRAEMVVVLPDSSGISIFELLAACHEVEFDRSTSGVFVKSIDSISNTRSAYWLYFVNDTAGTIASDRYMLRGGEKVEWRLVSSQ